MDTKMFEIRDVGTFISVLAVRLGARNEAESYLLREAGYSEDVEYILLTKLSGCQGHVHYAPFHSSAHDHYTWYDRTMHYSHKYIKDHWDELESGEVVDVEYILGETSTPKTTQRRGG